MCVCMCTRGAISAYRPPNPQVSAPGCAPACVGRDTRDGACPCGRGTHAWLHPVAPSSTHHLLPAPLGHRQPVGSPWGCAAARGCSTPAGQYQASGAGQEHCPQLLEPLRVLKWVLVVNTHTVPWAPGRQCSGLTRCCREHGAGKPDGLSGGQPNGAWDGTGGQNGQAVTFLGWMSQILAL